MSITCAGVRNLAGLHAPRWWTNRFALSRACRSPEAARLKQWKRSLAYWVDSSASGTSGAILDFASSARLGRQAETFFADGVALDFVRAAAKARPGGEEHSLDPWLGDRFRSSGEWAEQVDRNVRGEPGVLGIEQLDD